MAETNTTVAKTDNSNRLPANTAQPKTGELARQFRGDLSDVDTGHFERKLGAHIGNPELLRKRYAWDNYVMCVVNAQREALKQQGKQGTLEEMVGDPGNRTHLRGLLTVVLAAAKEADQTEIPLRIFVPEGDASLKVLDASLNGGAAILVKQGEVKGPLPKFTSKGVGVAKFTTAGHDPALFAAAKQLVEKFLPPAAK
ncbi:hypothetical protein KW798_03565 [Candidatus Parcubacteria bacterium]|nr:hypothetical protein [Candidatus Parcubacteria bacterium]